MMASASNSTVPVDWAKAAAGMNAAVEQRRISFFTWEPPRGRRGIQPPPDRHEDIDERRHQDDGEHHLGEHLAEDQPADREDAVKGDGDENQSVDDLAGDAGDRRAHPQKPAALALEADEDG